jgi:pantetheine-phosphate adenylyltransferase
VAVAVNPAKKHLCTVEERADMLARSIGDGPTVLIERIDEEELTVDFARGKGAKFLLRGFRNGIDVDNERQLEGANRKLAPDITTVYIGAPEDLVNVSSTAVRNMLGLRRWKDVVREFVPGPVFEAIVRKKEGETNHGRCI